MKRFLSLVTAAAIVLSVALPMATTVYAEETSATVTEQASTGSEATNETAEKQTAEDAKTPIEEVALLFEALPLVDEVKQMDAEQLKAACAQYDKAMAAFNALSVEDAKAFCEQYPELYKLVTEDLAKVLNNTDEIPGYQSLRPMEETTGVYLTLNGYSKSKLQKFPVDDVLKKLVDRAGGPIEVEDDYTTAWFYFEEDDFDEMHTVGTHDTVDLWSYYNKYATELSTSYRMYLVLGNGKQMDDANNHRYVVTVELNTGNEVYGCLNYNVYDKDGNFISSSDGHGARPDNEMLTKLNVPGQVFNFLVEDFNKNNPYTVKFDTYMRDDMKRSGYEVEVYSMGDFINYRDNKAALSGNIAEEIFGDGVTGKFAAAITASNLTKAPNVWCVVLRDAETSRIAGYFGLGVQIVEDTDITMSATLLKKKGGTSVKVAQDDVTLGNYDSMSFHLDPTQKNNPVKVSNYSAYSSFDFRLPDDCSIQEDYLLKLDKANVKAVYSGGYSSMEAITTYKPSNITSQILGSGYPVNLESSIRITVVTKNNEVRPCSVYAYGGASTSSGDADTVFSITGAKIAPESEDGYPTYVSTYVAAMAGSSGIPLDTYYLRDEKYDIGGYQLLLLNKVLTPEQIKNLIPSFRVTKGTQVNSGGIVESEKTSLKDAVWSDSPDDTVAFQVQVPGVKVKNYMVTFASKQEAPTLFVAGPDKRYVNLTADNNFVHDILVANLGSEALTGVKVELVNPVHVKLDDYWTIGGAGNDTIPAFTDTYAEYHPTDNPDDEIYNSYATLANIAKVRLLADGAGKISGTLRVTAANGQVRNIKLTGIAANPQIISGEMPNGVKYVPYSYMVATDNMFNWNRCTYKLTSGALPDGMSLYEATGEIYGVPTVAGTFKFEVQVDYSSSRFSPSSASYTIVVKDNADVTVSEATDAGYMLSKKLGEPKNLVSGYNSPEVWNHFIVDDTSTDQLIVSQGVIGEFRDLWLNGKRLVRNIDYEAVSGSTRITIKSQTFSKANQTGANTIAFEFREGGQTDGTLRRAAQNFYLNDTGSSGGGSGSGSGSGSADATATSAVTGGVTLQCILVTPNGAPLSGLTVELHSTPRVTTSNADGVAAFAGVEFGAHTLYVKSASGAVLTTRNFNLIKGDSTSASGMNFTVNDGGALAMTIAVNATSAPRTGDNSEMSMMLVLALISTGGAMFAFSKKRKNTK